MAYGLKWFSEFVDESGDNAYITEILERDFSGEAIEVTSAGNPIVIAEMGDNDPYTVIKAKKVTLEWISDEISGFEISDLFITDDKKYQFVFSRWDGLDKTMLFTGYLVFIDCSEPYNSKPYPVTISATCSLPFVRDGYYLDEFGAFVEGELSLIKIIANCLSVTDLQLPIHSHVNLFDQGMTHGSTSPLALAEIDADGLRGMKGGDVLERVLAAFGACIKQSLGRWYIIDIRAQESFLVDEWQFDYQGNATGFSEENHCASFGRTAYDEDTPNVFPIGGIGGVTVTLAEPNSIVTVNVEPGNQVNRLENGTFSGAVLGGVIPGWRNEIEGGTSWSRQGSGRPDDPYRLEFYDPVIYQPKLKQNKFRPLSYFETGPIVLNVGNFYVSENDRTDVKIVFSGALRMNNVLGVSMNLNLNENERDYASYLNESGEWLYSKKEDTEVAIQSNQAEAGPDKTYTEIKTQTFEITSQEITNLIKSGSDGLVYVRLRVFPGVHAPGFDYSVEVFASYEDLSLVIETGTVFEGNHKYQIDGKLPIRNANEISYTIGVADKIGIDTPENGRVENRVMTGYMTLVSGGDLTTGWVRYINGSVDPQDSDYDSIQKKVLKEKLRLYGGKRRIFEGNFKGIGLMPHHTIFNRFEESGDPEKFYTITGWEWAVKTMEYKCSFHELDFTKLTDEEVYLLDEQGGNRGNRLYSGGTSVSSGSGTKPPVKVEPILLDDIDPAYEYEILEEDTEDRVCDIVALIKSSHNANLLEVKLIYWPNWISEIEIYRGEDLPDIDIPETGILKVIWRGKPTASGHEQILVDISSSDGGHTILSIPIEVTPSTDFDETWPPIFDPITLTFTVGEESTQEVDLRDYMDSGHAEAVGYTFKLLNSIPWMSARSIVNMDLSVTGKPTAVGTSDMVWQIMDSIGRTEIFYVTLDAIAAAKVTAKVLDTTSGIVELGAIPGRYELPDDFDVSFDIDGPHTGYIATLTGGGLLGDLVSESRDEDFTESSGDTYRIFGTVGTPAEAGQYSLTVQVKRGPTLSEVVQFDFVLYDIAYLDLIQNGFLSDGLLVSYIDPDGTSVFDNDGVEIWGLTSEIDGPEHDKVTQKLYSESGTLLTTKVHTLMVSSTVGTYQLDTPPVFRGPGKYKLVTELELLSAPVMVSSVRFEVAGADETGCCEGYSANFGDGTSTNYTLTHGLNTKDLNVFFYRNSSGKSVEIDYWILDLDSIQVQVSTYAIPALNALRAVITPK